MISSNFIIYFHGNAEDVGCAYEFCEELRSEFHVNIILMEYPGYGVYGYKKIETTAD